MGYFGVANDLRYFECCLLNTVVEVLDFADTQIRARALCGQNIFFYSSIGLHLTAISPGDKQ